MGPQGAPLGSYLLPRNLTTDRVEAGSDPRIHRDPFLKPVVRPKWPVVKPVVKFEPGAPSIICTQHAAKKEDCCEKHWAFEFFLLEHGSVAWVLDRGVAYNHARVGSKISWRVGHGEHPCVFVLGYGEHPCVFVLDSAMVSILVSSSWAPPATKLNYRPC